MVILQPAGQRDRSSAARMLRESNRQSEERRGGADHRGRWPGIFSRSASACVGTLRERTELERSRPWISVRKRCHAGARRSRAGGESSGRRRGHRVDAAAGQSRLIAWTPGGRLTPPATKTSVSNLSAMALPTQQDNLGAEARAHRRQQAVTVRRGTARVHEILQHQQHGSRRKIAYLAKRFP